MTKITVTTIEIPATIQAIIHYTPYMPGAELVLHSPRSWPGVQYKIKNKNNNHTINNNDSI